MSIAKFKKTQKEINGMNKIRLIALFLAVLTLTTVSCGGEATPAETTQGDTETTTSDSYYRAVNYDGYEFTFLSPDQQYGCNVRVDIEEQSGEALDDAIYKRNRLVEDKLGVKIKEYQSPNGSGDWGTGQTALCNEIVTMVMAGDSDYDAAYLPFRFQPAVITDGYLLDMRSVKELQFGEKWWDNAINDELTIYGKLYAASGPLQMMTLDLTWALLFNQSIMDKRGMEAPYDLVREGKWTLDEFNKMVSGVAELNGAESFTWDSNGTAFYGIANHTGSPFAFLFAAGNLLVSEKNNDYVFTGDSERFLSTVDKLSTIFSGEGNAYTENGGISTGKGYIYAFNNDRALFCTAELKTTLELRSMKSDFGLVPMPKYDESQENYTSYVNPAACFLCIPKTVKDQSRAGTVIDALTYESYNMTLPVYYDITISQKGLRDENSLEMLELIRDGRSTQATNLFGVTYDLSASVCNVVIKNSGNAASLMASEKTTVLEKLEKLKEFYTE